MPEKKERKALTYQKVLSEYFCQEKKLFKLVQEVTGKNNHLRSKNEKVYFRLALLTIQFVKEKDKEWLLFSKKNTTNLLFLNTNKKEINLDSP